MSNGARTAWSIPRGIMHLPVACFDKNLKLDFETNARLIDFEIKHGATSICILMHLAEQLNLSMQERKDLTEQSIKAVAGRVPVLVHVSLSATDHVIELTQHAEKAGADAVVAIAPYYWKPTQDQIYEHFAAVMSASGLPFVGYHSPAFMDGIGIAPTTLRRLVERFPTQMIGLKEASHNFEQFIELRRAAQSINPDFGMITGIEYIIPAITLGGVGSMSIFAGVAPRLIQKLYDMTVAGEMSEALKLQDRVSALWQLGKGGYPAPIKTMMELMGRPVGQTRLPLLPTPPDVRARLEEELGKLGILDSEPQGW